MDPDFENIKKVESERNIQHVDALGDFVYVDGPSGIGKSTLSGKLSEFFSDSCLLPEYTDTVKSLPPGYRMPPSDASLEEHQKSAPMWALVDDFRRNLIVAHNLDLQEDSKSVSIIDTSPLMVIAFELAKEKDGLPSTVDAILSSYLESFATDSVDIYCPTHWIFLEGSSLAVQQRLLMRGADTIHPFLFEQGTIEFTQELYQHFRSNFLKETEYTVVESTSLSPESVFKEVRKVSTFSGQKKVFGFLTFVQTLFEARQAGSRLEGLL